jgi:acetyl-CoA C-acetyltransferase
MVAGGVESMTRPLGDGATRPFARGPQTAFDTSIGWRLINPRMAEMYGTLAMGETAERVAQKYEISREDQDAFALRSHQRAVAAQGSGRLGEEIVPVEVPQRKGSPVTVTGDEGPRADTSLEAMAGLRSHLPSAAGHGGQLVPAERRCVCPVPMSADEAKRPAQPLARAAAAAAAGVHRLRASAGAVEPEGAGEGRLQPSDMGVVELNEAFASQSLACVRLLGLDEERVNVNGGAIALGHPLGSSGSRLVGTLVREMQHRDAKYGLATMCIGVGQGIASIWERV